VIGTTGFYIDLTDTYRDEVKESVDEAVTELEQSRAVIEQAKSALMLVCGISADRAFDILIWRSQETNTRLRVLAELIVAGFGQCESGASLWDSPIPCARWFRRSRAVRSWRCRRASGTTATRRTGWYTPGPRRVRGLFRSIQCPHKINFVITSCAVTAAPARVPW